jgi:hypothetical protein
LKNAMMLCLCLLSFGAHAIEVDGKICTVRCVVPHKVVPKPILNKALWLCFQIQPLIIVLAAPSMALSLDLPPEVPLTPETVEAVPPMLDIPETIEGGGGHIDTGNPVVVGVFGTGGGYAPVGGGGPLIGAPEIDPSSGAAALTLLFGLLAVMRRRR